MLARRRANALALVLYAACSFAYFGWGLLPHPGRVIGGPGHDAEIFIWSLAWWPHAIGSWTNPFFTHAIYVPGGINLTWVTSVPGLALAFAPVTALFGPIVAYNVAWLLLPAVGAWTAYLLCRALTGSAWASLLGGYAFGFSSYAIGHEFAGHLNLTGVFLLPLVALVLVRYASGAIAGPGLAWRLGLLLAFQLLISTEVAATLTVVLAAALALGLLIVRERRRRLVGALAPILGSYLVAAVVTAPFLVYLFGGFVGGTSLDRSMSEPHGSPFGADLLNLVVPSPMAAIGGSTLASFSSRLGTNDIERGPYLGIPLLLVVAMLAYRRRRSPLVRYLVALLVAAFVLAAGDALYVAGHRLAPLPWALLRHLPGLSHVLPVRFAAYVSLAAAVLLALWVASSRGRIYPRPFVLPVLAVAALLPPFWGTGYPSFRPKPPAPLSFFTSGLYQSCLSPNEVVSVFPFSDAILWQAASGFRFRLATDGLQPFVIHERATNGFDADPIVQELTFVDDAHPTMETMLEFAAMHHVDRFVVDPATQAYPTARQLRAFGPVERIGGVLVAPACGKPPLAHRDLRPYAAEYRATLARSPGDVGWCTDHALSLIPYGMYPAGMLAGARKAIFVAGQGVACPPAPAGYRRHGFATAADHVMPHVYAYYAR